MTKILYVEDEPFLAKIVKESLESRGYEIKHLDSGDKAPEVFQLVKPDLCILDVMLPVQDGFQIAEKIRTFNSSTPIIFLTAKEQTEDVVSGFHAGGNDYVKKPFSMEELILRIENLLELTGNVKSASAEIVMGNYTFIPDALLLRHDQEEIRLSHRESEILKMLCAHRSQKLERKKMLLDIWGDDSFFNSRNLDVYIRKLRTYLKKDTRVQIITLKGIGYHFHINTT